MDIMIYSGESYPESADLDELGDEVAADVEGDEGF